MILIVGGPRSGTTWLAKIFDSHPDVLYRHEPDTADRDLKLQRPFAACEIGAHLGAARAYLDRLIGIRDVAVAGIPPGFSKSFTPRIATLARAPLVLALRAAELLGRQLGLRLHVRVPDLVRRADRDRVRLVIKSVTSRMRLRLFAQALPGCHVVLILRDPFGHVASMRRGVELGKFESDPSLGECLMLDEARRRGMTRERFAALNPVERHAWHWVLLNEKAVNDLAGVPGGMVVRYRDLCLDPIATARTLFGATGLAWNRQTEAFLRRSTTPGLFDRYYQVRKDSLQSLTKWRSQLSAEECGQILAIFRESTLWDRYPEFHDMAPCGRPATDHADAQ